MRALNTIYALASAPGRAGVAVIRISGAHAGNTLDVLVGNRPQPRRASLRTLRHPGSREPLDRGLVLWLPGPGTFTGEDTAELHVHGGRAVVRAILEALHRLPHCRMAEPGEFARRAFTNGRLDLTAAEGLADLIDAETEAQRRQALRQADGALARLYDRWRSEIIAASALVTAAIDFSDEADVATDALARARIAIEGLSAEIARHLADGHRGEILRDGFRVVLAGAPNVGKSSLLNALARREAAIVSDEAGTTRDVIEVRLDLDGVPVVIADTAGLRETTGAIEREGIRRTMAEARDADLILWLDDGFGPAPDLPPDLTALAPERLCRVRTKSDLGDAPGQRNTDPGALTISVASGAGIDRLTRRIAALALDRIGPATEAPAITQARHRSHLDSAAAGLAAFLAGPAQAIELRAEDLRQSADALGRITGRIDIEDVLDAVFSRFCIGK